MNRGRRLGRVGGLAVSVAAAPFACLWVLQVSDTKEPLTAAVRLDLVDAGMLSYLLFAAPLVVLAGSAAAAAGRSFRTGLWACAWATVLGGLLIVVAWLAEAPSWYRQAGGLLLDAEGGVGMGPTWAMPSGGP
jgi:hypothetical protein